VILLSSKILTQATNLLKAKMSDHTVKRQTSNVFQ
jgi:hypothetical protein